MKQEDANKPTGDVATPASREQLESALRSIEDRSWDMATRYADQVLGGCTFIPPRKADFFRRRCREDLLYHLEYLRSALYTGVPEVFSNYTRWIDEVLVHRGVAKGCLIPALHFLEAEIRPLLPAGEIPLFERVMMAGTQAVEGREFSNAANTDLTREDSSELFVRALLASNRLLAQEILSNSAANAQSLFQSLSRIVAPAMYEIGRLWQRGHISITEEHLATGIANLAIRSAYHKLQKPAHTKKKVILACTEANQHSMGVEMVSWVFEMAGWETIFLGANAPSDALLNMIDRQQPDGIGLSVSTAPQLRAALRICEEVHADFHTRTPAILIGGYLFHEVPELQRLPRADAVLKDVSQLSLMIGAHTGKRHSSG